MRPGVPASLLGDPLPGLMVPQDPRQFFPEVRQVVRERHAMDAGLDDADVLVRFGAEQKPPAGHHLEVAGTDDPVTGRRREVNLAVIDDPGVLLAGRDLIAAPLGPVILERRKAGTRQQGLDLPPNGISVDGPENPMSTGWGVP